MDTGTFVAICGVVVGSLGFIYGLRKDRKIREIEKRAKSPHFVPVLLQIDARGKTMPQGGKSYYSYGERERDPVEHLFHMDPYETEVPADYPDNRLVSLLARNQGSNIRFFSTTCNEYFVLNKSDYHDDCYEFRYRLRDGDRGKELEVKISFETEAGIQGSQTWVLTKGRVGLTRTEPRTV